MFGLLTKTYLLLNLILLIFKKGRGRRNVRHQWWSWWDISIDKPHLMLIHLVQNLRWRRNSCLWRHRNIWRRNIQWRSIRNLFMRPILVGWSKLVFIDGWTIFISLLRILIGVSILSCLTLLLEREWIVYIGNIWIRLSSWISIVLRIRLVVRIWFA